MRTVALSSQQAPGTPSGVNYTGALGSPALNDAGQTAFTANLTGSGVDSTNSRGVWSEGSGSLALVARSGSQAPGMSSGVNYSNSNSFSSILNNAGQTAFRASLTDGSNGTWSGGSGSLTLVARTGSQAPGTASGVNYGAFATLRPLLNDAGQTAFQAILTGSGVDSTNEIGTWSEGSGSLALVARTGSQAPGTPSGVYFSGDATVTALGSPVLNDAGQVAFEAGLTGSGVDNSNFQGIWSERSGSLALVARTGSQAPGMPSGVNFSYLDFAGPALNNAGQTAFVAKFTDGAKAFGPSGPQPGPCGQRWESGPRHAHGRELRWRFASIRTKQRRSNRVLLYPHWQRCGFQQ